MAEDGAPASGPFQALATLLDLSRRARQSVSARELGFLLANDTHGLAPYRQAALWLADEGVHTLSGLVQVEANAPYALWLTQLCRHLAASGLGKTQALTAADVPPDLAQHWAEWWPAHALWLEMPTDATAPTITAAGGAGLLLVRDAPWPEVTQTLLREWVDAWWHAFRAVHRPRVRSLQGMVSRFKRTFERQPGQPWWRQTAWRWSVLTLVVMVLPVRLTVMAPGELVPANPVVIRAPLDGVVDVFHVQPNQLVKKDQPLFGFDEALIQSRLAVAVQMLATAVTEYRQTSQQALTDVRVRPQLSVLTGKIEERRAEVDFLNNQLARARVLAPQDGVALFDDPAEWIGRPVTVGERIMRIAEPQDNEVEAWLPLADAISLQPGASVNLYLNASPLFAVSATLRYMAHDAVQRPDGTYAYRVRAELQTPTPHRVGLKGTAKLNGSWVPLVYWAMRRPLASARSALGI